MSFSWQIGRDIYEFAGLNPLEPPPGGAADVALKAFGPTVLRLQPRALAEADVVTIDGERRIVVRTELSPARKNFAIGVAVVQLYIERSPIAELSRPAVDALCNSAGAWVAAPTPAVACFLLRYGVDIAALAEAFTLTETAAAMRVTEAGGPDSLVTTPTRVHRRGPGLSWIQDADARRLAASRAPRSVRRVVVQDEPGRVALFALAS